MSAVINAPAFRVRLAVACVPFEPEAHRHPAASAGSGRDPFRSAATARTTTPGARPGSMGERVVTTTEGRGAGQMEPVTTTEGRGAGQMKPVTTTEGRGAGQMEAVTTTEGRGAGQMEAVTTTEGRGAGQMEADLSTRRGLESRRQLHGESGRIGESRRRRGVR